MGQEEGIFFPSMECFLSSLLKHTENPLTGSTVEILHGVGVIFQQKKLQQQNLVTLVRIIILKVAGAGHWLV